MSSESVWFEQVDTALIDYITDVVKLQDTHGNFVPVPVKIRKPDKDFMIEEYPSITLYNIYSQRDSIRYNPESVVTSRDVLRNKLIEEKNAIPYTLVYQLDFWSKLQKDMNDMTRQWLGHNPDKYINLPVKDVSGNDRNSFMLLTGNLVKRDYLKAKERTFNSSITYKIWVELDERIKVESDMVTKVSRKFVRIGNPSKTVNRKLLHTIYEGRVMTVSRNYGPYVIK